ncbi:MAG TPA: hypothetical protein H9881_08160 [Candidatus Stackebrandtia excrementipullorum]|nr:hypothetical protein [Candidatus Stackebrandtia excrementipullorum]
MFNDERAAMRMIGVLLLSVLLLAGCGDGEDTSSTPERHTEREWATDMADCLTDKGWNVTAGSDGSLSAETPTEQYEQYESDREDCSAELGYDQPLPVRTAEEAEAYFDALLEAADCVRDLGYTVADPPSRQYAVEQIQQPVIDLGWDPYDAVRPLSEETIEEVFTACPEPV